MSNTFVSSICLQDLKAINDGLDTDLFFVKSGKLVLRDDVSKQNVLIDTREPIYHITLHGY